MLKREGNEFPLVCVFSGSFGVRSIVLCKCSGKVLIGYVNALVNVSVLFCCSRMKYEITLVKIIVVNCQLQLN